MKKEERTALFDIYFRTYKNCQYYETEGMKNALNNEIGVLRGILYCIEATKYPEYQMEVLWDQFDHWRKLQLEMREDKK